MSGNMRDGMVVISCARLASAKASICAWLQQRGGSAGFAEWQVCMAHVCFYLASRRVAHLSVCWRSS